MTDTAALTKVKGLGDAPSWIRPDEAALASMLIDQRQAHLFAGWKEGADVEKKHKFFDQVRAWAL
jgi:hypothetical protein